MPNLRTWRLSWMSCGCVRISGVLVDGHQVHNPKPHPDVYLRAAELLNIAPADCVVFEDSHSGVAAGGCGGNAGCWLAYYFR